MAEPFAETGGTGEQGGRECSFGGGDSRPITNSIKETSCTHYVAYERSFSFPFLQFPPLPPSSPSHAVRIISQFITQQTVISAACLAACEALKFIK